MGTAHHGAAERVKIKVMLDDRLPKELDLVPLHALSLYLEIEGSVGKERVLFNTGPSLKALSYNASRMGVRLDSLDYLFISDWKRAHSAAFDEFVEAYGLERAYAPPLTESLTLYKPKQTHLLEVVRSPYPVKVGRYSLSTGAKGVKWFKEHALIILLEDGHSVLIIGCAAYGALGFIEASKEASRGLKALIGGLHLSSIDYLGLKGLREALKGQPLRYLIPLHCTSPAVRRKIIMPPGLISECGVGLELTIDSGE